MAFMDRSGSPQPGGGITVEGHSVTISVHKYACKVVRVCMR